MQKAQGPKQKQWRILVIHQKGIIVNYKKNGKSLIKKKIRCIKSQI